MIRFNFTVRGDRITRENENSFVEGNINSYKAVFDFGNEDIWNGIAKLCIIEADSGDVYRLPLIDDVCAIPELVKGNFKIGAMGVDTYDGDIVEEAVVISTNMHRCEVVEGASKKEANAELNSAAEVWMKYIADMEAKRVSCEKSADEARISAESAKESATSVQKIAEMTVSAENLPEGEPANVIKTEDENSLHLTFYIPKGDTGPQGPQGVQGDKGDKGDTGDKGEQGIQGPKGDKGDTGPQGPQGVQGDKGDTGDKGPQGEKGDSYTLDIVEIGDVETANVEIIKDAIISYGIISASLITSLGEGHQQIGFTSCLCFATPSEMPSNYSQFPADVYFKGDSTDNGAFVPEANMRYTIVFDFDGYMLNGYVSGVSMV